MFGMILKYHSWEPEVQVIHKCDFVVFLLLRSLYTVAVGRRKEPAYFCL